MEASQFFQIEWKQPSRLLNTVYAPNRSVIVTRKQTMSMNKITRTPLSCVATHILFFAICVLAHTTLYAGGLEDGVSAYDDKDYDRAVMLLSPLALQGVAQAQHLVGKMSYYGYGLPKDLKSAAEWWLKAANQNWPDSVYNMGFVYEKGKGVEKDYQKALDWYLKAERLGVDDAAYKLGLFYDKGMGVEVDHEKAAAFLNKGVEYGHAPSMKAWGDRYVYGTGVAENPVKAYYWYQRAVSAGHKKAIEHADVVRQNLTKAQIQEAERLLAAETQKAPAVRAEPKKAPPAVAAANMKPTAAPPQQQPRQAQKSAAGEGTVESCFDKTGVKDLCYESCAIKHAADYLKNVTESERQEREKLCRLGCDEADAAYPQAADRYLDKKWKDPCLGLFKAFDKVVGESFTTARQRNYTDGNRRGYTTGWKSYMWELMGNQGTWRSKVRKNRAPGKDRKTIPGGNESGDDQDKALDQAEIEEVMSEFFR
jgi:TPR repeat protein